MPRKILYLVLSILALTLPARAGQSGHFGNDTIALDWTVDGPHLQNMTIEDRLNHEHFAVTAPFLVELADGMKIGPTDWRLVSAPAPGALAGDPKASRLSERSERRILSARFTDPGERFGVDWRLVQSPSSSYLREEVTITALHANEPIRGVYLMSSTAPGAGVVGRVAGSPVVAGDTYWQFENPLSKSEADVNTDKVELWIERVLPLVKGQSITYSVAVGAVHDGQLRRDFAAYLEQERAHPYRTFLHYNSWYDIGFETRYTQADALDRINRFGEELTVKRGVKLDSFLFDDGWDDRSGSWTFDKAFPNGFLPLKDAAARFGAAPGIWLSPWGGYDEPKRERIAAGRAKGYEIIDDGFALSGPRYYERFHAAALDLVTRQGVNQFKLDGTGNADKVFPGSRFDSDFAAAIQLISDLRRAKPDLFINLSTGTYPSPAWLSTADAIWRGGKDHAFTGVGTPRERWITYRDRETYENVVVRAPLFPLNALMLHGIIYAKSAPGLDSDPGGDFANEVRSYFGTGVALQELYITPSLLTAQDWDTLAEAARWSRDNGAILKDTHWIGGDPGRLEVYGWGAWSPAKAIVTLRNPDTKPHTIMLDVGRALELPLNAPRNYQAHSPWKADRSQPSVPFHAGTETPVTLKPFEVRTLELLPR